MARTTLFPAIVLTAVIAAGCGTAGRNVSGGTFALPGAAPTDRLFVASLHLTGLDPIYAAERERLERVCPGPRPEGDTCRSRNVSPQRHRVASLHSRPAVTSPPAAFIYARFDFRPEYDVVIALDLEFADKPGAFIPWIPDAGDWGYGIHIDGRVRVEGDWVQFVDPTIRVPAWAPKGYQERNPELSISVESIDGEILEMRSLEATTPNGDREVIAPGDFLVTRVSRDVVEFRLEVESDFACGEDIPPPPEMPPLLRANPREFFDPDGTPRFTTKYSKGC